MEGAVVIDVRTPAEYDRGKVPESINIPVDRISASTARIKEMNKPVILCCESGFRSSQAHKLLKAAGLSKVLNGGSWASVLSVKNKL